MSAPQGPDYAEVAAVAASAAGDLDPALLGDFLATAAAAVGSGTRVRRRDLQRFAERGRLAARLGVPLRALVDLYLTAAWRLWNRLPEVADPGGDPRRPVQAGQVMLRATADVTAVLAEGYQLARRDLVRAQEAERREFVDDLLLGGSQSLSSLLERAARFGLALAGPHTVLVVSAEEPFNDTSPLVGVLERSILGSLADADALVVVREGRLVVVFAAPDRPAIDHVVETLAARLPASPAEAASTPVRLHRTAAVGAWKMGVGRPHQGPAGVRLSYQEATEALALGERVAHDGRIRSVFYAADLLLHRVLVRDEAAMREFLESVLSPLSGARGGAGALLQTLSAFFAAGANAAAAARDLHLSVRAFTYRLDRIRTLTGLDATAATDRFTLQTAVTGARLLLWTPDA